MAPPHVSAALGERGGISTFGLTDLLVQEFQDICSAEGIALGTGEAADAARRVLVFYRTLLGPLPEDIDPDPTAVSSNSAPAFQPPTGEVH